MGFWKRVGKWWIENGINHREPYRCQTCGKEVVETHCVSCLSLAFGIFKRKIRVATQVRFKRLNAWCDFLSNENENLNDVDVENMGFREKIIQLEDVIKKAFWANNKSIEQCLAGMKNRGHC